MAALALAPGALAFGALAHGVEGVSLAEGAPLAAFRSAFPAARFPGLPQALRETGSITAALRACGLPDYTRAATRISAHAARPALAARLRIAAGAPILRPVAVNVDADGAPVEYGVTWFAGERVTLTVAPEGCAAPRGRAALPLGRRQRERPGAAAAARSSPRHRPWRSLSPNGGGRGSPSPQRAHSPADNRKVRARHRPAAGVAVVASGVRTARRGGRPGTRAGRSRAFRRG